MVEHRYGGLWTQIKLDALERYLSFYTTALKYQPFELWYVDAFAGSGDRIVEQEAGGLFDGTVPRIEESRADGSAKIAIATVPAFERLIFIENDPARYEALIELRDANPSRRIDCYKEDANILVRALCDADHWRAPQSRGRPVRAVVFLDPYGMQVEWQTREAIKQTEAIDLLYLFPIGAVLRQAAVDLSKVDPHKEAALTKLYGGRSWREEWYRESPQADLLQAKPPILRSATKQEIEAGFKLKLETLFPYVSSPLPLLTPGGAQLYSLFLAVSNPRAVALAKNVVASVMRPR
jgi:three-Cys-motif partner protein